MPLPWTVPTSDGEAIGPSMALCDAAAMLAAHANADAIVAVTRAGWTARLLSSRRPNVPVVAATDSEDVARRLTLWRGVVPIVCPLNGEIDAVVSRVLDETLARGVVPPGALVVAVNSDRELGATSANFVRLRRL